MSDLYPTKTRLALLRDVAAGSIRRYYPFNAHNPPYAIEIVAHNRVTARVDEAEKAGWVELDPQDDGLRYQRYRLTAAGRAVLGGAS